MISMTTMPCLMVYLVAWSAAGGSPKLGSAVVVRVVGCDPHTGSLELNLI